MRMSLGLAALVLVAGCNSSSDPFAGGDGGGGRDAGTVVDAGAGGPDASGPENWPSTPEPKPARLVILGDSIAACSTVGGKDNADCAAKKLHVALEATNPGLVYQNLAVGGAVTANVPDSQLAGVTTGPGHVLVVLTIGGNDLSPYIFQSDATTQAGYDMKKPKLLADWERIFAFFADTSKFPDGATILMNTQYNPFDDCTASPYNLSALKIELLHSFNQELVNLARSHAHAFIADPYRRFLGHGHHYNVDTCPNYMAGAAYWMGDLIHPNVTGHDELSKVWVDAAAHILPTSP